MSSPVYVIEYVGGGPHDGDFKPCPNALEGVSPGEIVVNDVEGHCYRGQVTPGGGAVWKKPSSGKWEANTRIIPVYYEGRFPGKE